GCARSGKAPEGTLEGAPPAGLGGVGVVVSGHERDRVRIEARVLEHLGEVLELGLLAELGEVARDDDVIGPALLRGAERTRELSGARARIDRAPQAHELRRDAVARVRPSRPRIEDVYVGEVSDASHGIASVEAKCEETLAPPWSVDRPGARRHVLHAGNL